MTYNQFLAAHPELAGLPQPTIDDLYLQYMEAFNQGMEMIEDAIE